MSDGLQDGAKRLEADGDVEQVCGVEKVIEVAENGEEEVEEDVEEGLRLAGRQLIYHNYN